MWNADSAREEADARAMRAWEAEQDAFEKAWEAWRDEHGPLYHFTQYCWEPEEHEQARSIEKYGKRVQELEPAQIEELLRQFFAGGVYRFLIINIDGMVEFEEGLPTDDYNGETIDGERFDW